MTVMATRARRPRIAAANVPALPANSIKAPHHHHGSFTVCADRFHFDALFDASVPYAFDHLLYGHWQLHMALTDTLFYSETFP